MIGFLELSKVSCIKVQALFFAAAVCTMFALDRKLRRP